MNHKRGGQPLTEFKNFLEKTGVSMNERRIKYVEAGTGQVGYLVQGGEEESWVFELFTGGPEPYHRVREWDSKEQAEVSLQEMGFTVAAES